jgi:carbon-monoxide dehydrogenase large subunit
MIARSIEAEKANGKYIGASVRRVNDPKYITGRGQYVDDISLPGALHIAFVRSPHAHADIRSIDTSAAHEVPGVVAFVTGREATAWMKPDRPHEPLLPGRTLERYPLTPDRARYAGDAVVAVFAESAAAAEDAAERVVVDYSVLGAVVRADDAMRSDAPIIHAGWESNVAWHWSVESGDVEAAFVEAEHVVTLDSVVQRVAAVFIEPRGVAVTYDALLDEMTIWSSTQVPHRVRTHIAELVGVPEHHIRSVAPDVGGGFGSKGGVYPEYIFAAAAARHYGRPIKWIETRSEHFVATHHGRDQLQHLEAAVSSDGVINGLRVRVLANCGAYGAASVGQRTGIMSSGPYRIVNLRSDVYGVMTNTTPTSAYRGAGRPEAAYMLERLIDRIADQLDLNPVQVRLRNFIQPDEFPYRSATGALYDSGDYPGALHKALAMLGWSETRGEQARQRAEGRIVGAGIGVYCEFAGPGWDSAEVRVTPTGRAVVMTGISPHGQGNETSLAQIVADTLAIPFDWITVKASDTAIVPQGVGTFGSRGTAIGGGATLLAARKVADKARQFAAAMLEVASDDIELADGAAHVIGAPDRSVSFERIASAAHSMGGTPGRLEPGLDAQAFFQPDGRQFPFGVHLATVELDRDTGEVAVTRYVAVDDCGTIINPLLVDGQKHGGLAQGFGQALWEAMVYDEQGQPLSQSLMDYAAPRADQLPWFELDSTVTPSPFTPHGAKGIGEAGTTGAPPAIVNAVLDALRPHGITAIDMPLSAEKVWKALNNAG